MLIGCNGERKGTFNTQTGRHEEKSTEDEIFLGVGVVDMLDTQFASHTSIANDEKAFTISDKCVTRKKIL